MLVLNYLIIDPYQAAFETLKIAKLYLTASLVKKPHMAKYENLIKKLNSTTCCKPNFSNRILLFKKGAQRLAIGILKLIPIINILFMKIWKLENRQANAKAGQVNYFPLLKSFSLKNQSKIDSCSIRLNGLYHRTYQHSAKEFALIQKITRKEITENKGFVRFCDTSQPSKDRYAKFRPFQHNYFGKEAGEHYLSASKIQAGGQSYIATQAPIKDEDDLADTVADFFSAIIKNGSNTIVTLVMPHELNKIKCAPYWFPEHQPLRLSDGTIVRLHQEIVQKEGPLLIEGEQQRIVQRDFIVEKMGEPSKVITQFHYENWPDYGLPQDQLFDDLLEIINRHPIEKALFVHCHAGVGRTGTFIACHSMHASISKQLKTGVRAEEIEVNFAKHLLHLRTQRLDDFVNNTEQYDFFNRFIIRKYEPVSVQSLKR